MKFIENLRMFHEKMISEWYNHSGSLIGLSIQVLDDLQDEDSVTRTTLNTHADEYLQENQTLINHYCYNIIQQDGNFANCNKLDFYLKQYLQKHTEYTKIICQCHGGVTNILIKWKLDKSNINWYVFIGQFLLEKIDNENLNNHFFETTGLVELKKTLLEKQFKNVGSMVNEGGFVDKAYHENLMRGIEQKGKDAIALVSVEKYCFFEDYVLKSFENFIRQYMVNSNGFLLPNETLKEYCEHIDPKNLKFHFDECLKIKLQENSLETKRLVEQISEKIITFNGKIPLATLKMLKELALSHINGGVGTPKFIRNSKSILKEISNLK